MLPPRQTPHSTKLPGILLSAMYSVAEQTAAMRSGVVSVNGVTCSIVATHSGRKSTG